MDFDDYQQRAIATAADIDNFTQKLTCFLGLSGESGELADHLKKHLGHGHPFDLDYVIKELGDILWYIAVLAHNQGVPLSQIAERNITKLANRYPEGFSTERSLNRKDA